MSDVKAVLKMHQNPLLECKIEDDGEDKDKDDFLVHQPFGAMQ